MTVGTPCLPGYGCTLFASVTRKTRLVGMVKGVVDNDGEEVQFDSLTVTLSSNYSRISKSKQEWLSSFYFPAFGNQKKERKVSINLLSNFLHWSNFLSFLGPFKWVIIGTCTPIPIPIPIPIPVAEEALQQKMKGIKGRFLRKLKSIPTITSLKQGLVFHVNPSNQNFQTSPVYKEQEQKNNHPDLNSANICAPKVLNDAKDEEMESGLSGGDRESIRPPSIKSKDMVPTEHKAEIGIALVSGGDIIGTVPSSGATEVQACDFQLVDPLLEEFDTSHNFQQQQNTNTHRLLDLKPVASFEPIVLMEEDTRYSEEFPTLSGLVVKCPPGGSDSVILYTTSLRGIRKTFEDCNTIRFLLESFRVLFYERDVSMHLEFREELWRILGGRVVPPRLFIKGRHIGGADEVVGLHEQGELKKLLQGIPLNPSNAPCNGCAGVRFILCSNCSGSCRLIQDDQPQPQPQPQPNVLSIRCPECNENGLVKCPLCC